MEDDFDASPCAIGMMQVKGQGIEMQRDLVAETRVKAATLRNARMEADPSNEFKDVQLKPNPQKRRPDQASRACLAAAIAAHGSLRKQLYAKRSKGSASLAWGAQVLLLALPSLPLHLGGSPTCSLVAWHRGMRSAVSCFRGKNLVTSAGLRTALCHRLVSQGCCLGHCAQEEGTLWTRACRAAPKMSSEHTDDSSHWTGASGFGTSGRLPTLYVRACRCADPFLDFRVQFLQPRLRAGN